MASSYSERKIPMLPGDVIAIYTDGLTEAGPNRLNMLGVDGVASLLAEKSPQDDLGTSEEIAESIALRMIKGVDEYGADGVRDDVCLLVGVVKET